MKTTEAGAFRYTLEGQWRLEVRSHEVVRPAQAVPMNVHLRWCRHTSVPQEDVRDHELTSGLCVQIRHALVHRFREARHDGLEKGIGGERTAGEAKFRQFLATELAGTAGEGLARQMQLKCAVGRLALPA